jgi:uncharacterized protein YfiM (DUF2279 family)
LKAHHKIYLGVAIWMAAASVMLLTMASAHATDKHPPKEPRPVQDSGLYFTNNDKSEHAVFGAIAGFAGRLQFQDNRWKAMAVPAAIGLLKELADSTQSGNHFSGKDLAATIAGGALGMYIGDGAIYLSRERGVTRVSLAVTF